MKREVDFDVVMVTIRPNEYKLLAKFFRVDQLKIIFDRNGLIYPMKFDFGKTIHRLNGKVVEYQANDVEQIITEDEQLDLF